MDFGEVLWSLLIFYLIFFYFMILFRVIGDLFTDHETSGLAKTAWLVILLVLPFISLFVYTITRGREMTERSLARARAAEAAQQEYIREVAGNSSNEPAGQIARAQDLLKSGAISPAEFDALKAKALA